jgi:hypothetical protein
MGTSPQQNPNDNLTRRIEAARAVADTSIDPSDHMLKNALEGVESAGRYRAEREKYTAKHGTADPDSFPKWSEVSEPGTVSRGPFIERGEPPD